MKIVNTTKALVLKKNETARFDDPTKMTYSLLIMQDDDAGKVSCPKEIYDAVQEKEVVTFITVYNPESEWSKFRITGIAKTASAKANS